MPRSSRRTAEACSTLVTAQKLRCREKRREARDGLAQHRFVAGDIQQLLGCAHAAARPEARAATAG